MSPTRFVTTGTVPLLRVLPLVALGALLASGGVSRADIHQIFEEGGGSLPNQARLGGPDDDAVSPLSGDVEVTVKVGPRLHAGGGLELELALHYSSKIWVHYWTNAPVRALKRLGPYGVGWRLHLGRVYASCRNGCNPESALGHLEWTYESADGAQHPIAFDVPTGELRYHGTTDATYVRAEPLDEGGRVVHAEEPAARVALWRLSMGGGVVHTLARRLESTDAAHADDLSDDFRGWYTTRIERWDAPGHAVGAIVVAYEPDPALAHCISRVDLLSPDPSGSLRSRGHVSFQSAARLDPADPSTSVEGGLTRAITFPAVEGQAAAEATYDLVYQGPVTLRLDVPGADPPPAYGEQFLLAAVRLPEARPGAERYEWRFEYDLGASGASGTGELIRRRIPTGALVEYEHATYQYEPPGRGQVVTLREVVSKRLLLDPGAAEPAAAWTFDRQRYSTVHPVLTVVADPFGNHTVYQFGRWECSYGCEAPWNAMLATSIKTFQGRSDGTGVLLRTVKTRYGADDYDRGFNVVPVSEWTVHHDWQGKLSGTRGEERGPFGHFSRTLEFGYTGRSVTDSLPLYELPLRQMLVTYDEIDPNDPADAARWSLWSLHEATARVIASSDGRPLQRTTIEYSDDGRVLRRVQHLDPTSPDPEAPGNLVTRNLYDPTTLALERSYTRANGSPGAHGSRIEYLDGVFPVRSYILDPDDPEGTGSRAFDYPSESVVREAATGTLLAVLQPAGGRTDFSYL